MSQKIRGFWLGAVALGILLASGDAALAWDVQEKCTNTTGQPAHDLTKIVLGGTGVSSAITNQLGEPSITTHTPVGGGTTVSIIHWGPGGTPVPNGGWVWGCFNHTGSAPWVTAAYWTDEEGNFIGPAAVEVSVNERRDGNGNWADVVHTWRDWSGSGFPPGPEDQLGAPRGPITGTAVFYAITDHLRPLEDLNEDLYTDPTIEWQPLSDFQLNAGETAPYNLGMLAPSAVVLLRFVASGEGIATETIHQFQPGESVPTLSEWAVAVFVLLLLTAGTVMFGRRRRAAAA